MGGGWGEVEVRGEGGVSFTTKRHKGGDIRTEAACVFSLSTEI